MTIYADLLRYRELFANLFRRDLSAKYRGSALGVLWSLAHPLLLMAAYTLVFSLLVPVVDVDIDPYPLFLLSGLSVWIFFSTAVQAAARSLLENANLIRKIRFPRQLVPLSVVATHLVSFLAMLAGLVLVNAIFLPRTRDTVWLSLPLAVVLVALVAGLALAVAAANVVFRDVEHVVAALFLPWFFLTPVLYRLDDLPGDVHLAPWLHDLLRYGNVMTPPIDAVRDPLFFGELPRLADVLYLCGAAVGALALGAFVFNRVDDQIAVEV